MLCTYTLQFWLPPIEIITLTDIPDLFRYRTLLIYVRNRLLFKKNIGLWHIWSLPVILWCHSVVIPSMGVPQLHFVRWGSRKIWSTICSAAVGCGWPGECWFFHPYCTEICSQERLRFDLIYHVYFQHWPLQPRWQWRTTLSMRTSFLFFTLITGL